MKRIVFISLLMMSLAAFVSCEKSGVYKPSGKISAIWYEWKSEIIVENGTGGSVTVPKYQREAWEWDGKKLKSRTVYNKDKSLRYNYVYEYNKKNMLIGITIPSEEETRIRFIYDDKDVLKSIKYFTATFSDNSLPYKWIEFSYDGNKVSSVKETINTSRYPRTSIAEPSFLSYMVSEEMANEIETSAVNSKIEYDIAVNEYVFEWEKKNISKVTKTTTKGGNSSVASITYTYDKKKNPFKARFADFIEDDDFGYSILSKNNIVNCTYSDPNMTITEECQYTYDDKNPKEKHVTRVKIEGSVTTKTSETWSCEYVD